MADRLDKTRDTVRCIIVSFDLEDRDNRVEVDIGPLNPSIARAILAAAHQAVSRADDELANLFVLRGDVLLHEDDAASRDSADDD